MKTLGIVVGAAAALALFGCSDAKVATADPARGEKVHEACLQCHGTEVYVSADRKVRSMKALREEVGEWADYYNPKMSDQEVEDLVAYLNTNFYKF